MRILLAFDKFKDACSAPELVALATDCLTRMNPEVDIRTRPLTDGGEGFVRILTAAVEGEIESLSVSDPLGRPIAAEYGLIQLDRLPPAARQSLQLPGEAALLGIVEMAQAAGLEKVSPDKRNPWHTTTYGVGQILRAVAARGVDGILLGLGGSATNDLGFGALAALRKGTEPVPPGWVFPHHWPHHPIPFQPSGLIAMPPLRFACDVDHPLLGERGATAVFGPQKGLPKSEVSRMDRALADQAAALEKLFAVEARGRDEAGAGAAGGLSFGLKIAFGGMRIAGATLVSEWQNWTDNLAWADVVITGEGRVDDGFFHGKGPGALARAALAQGKTVHVFCGSLDANVVNPAPGKLHLHSITPPGTPLPQALAETRTNLLRSLEGRMGGKDEG